MENYTLSDIASATNGDGFGGNNGAFWIFALLLLANGGIGFGNRGYEQYATAASQQEILFGQQFQNLDNKMDRLGNGIADATFALNNSIKDGNAMVAGRVVDEGRALQTQIAECCCTTKEAIHAEGEATRALIQQNKIEALQNRLQTVEMQQAIGQATAGVVRYPMATTYTSGANPFCGCNCNNAI